jgi:hypothetical protein
MKLNVLNVPNALNIALCMRSKTDNKKITKELIIIIRNQKVLKMKKNMGTTDKLIRILVAVVFVILYFTHIVSGTLGIVLLVLAGIFVLTSLLSICPLYMPFGLSTRKKE